MHRVDEYRQRAEAAEANAARAKDKLIRQQFLDVAHQWRELARQAGDLAREEGGAREPLPPPAP